MGIFSKIFGRKEAKGAEQRDEKVIEIALPELGKWIDEKTSAQRNEFEKKLMSKFAEIKQSMREIRLQLNEISQKEISTEEGNKRLRKIVDTSKQGMIRSMQNLLVRLEVPKTQDYKALSDYCNNASTLLQAEISAFGKSIAYTGILLQAEIKRIGDSINTLAQQFNQIRAIFEESSVMYIPQIKGKIREIETEISGMEAAKNSLPKIEQEIALLEASREDALKGTNALKVSLEYEGLQKMQDERNELLAQKQRSKENILQQFAPLEKPLRKLQNLSANKQTAFGKNEETALNQYLLNPLLAIPQDADAKALNLLMHSLLNAMNSGLIDFKDEKEREKKSTAISELIEGNLFPKEFSAYMKLNESIAELEKKLQESNIARRISEKEENARSIERGIGQMNSELAGAQNSLQKREQEISAHLEEISKIASKASNANVKVSIAKSPHGQ